MNPIGIKQRLRLWLDRILRIDRSSEYGLMEPGAYLAPDTILFSKKNLYLHAGASIPGGAEILNPRSKFTMGRNSFASYNLKVCPGNHMALVGKWKKEVTDELKDQLDPTHRYDRDITIEEDVWIGINVTLLNGAHIGRGCIVGAGCVVSGEWPPYAVIAGNPARIIRFLFTPDEIIEHERVLYPEAERLPRELLEENVRQWQEKAKKQ